MAPSRNPGTVSGRPHEACGAVAVRVVAARLRVIPRLVRAAARAGGGTGHDGAAVHALRVATRRARAALDVFGPLLGPRKRSRFARRLRRLRRAAGEARDIDVLLERITTRSGESRSSAASRALIERLRRERVAAGAPLARLASRLRNRRWERRIGGLLATVRGRRAAEPFSDFATRRLAKVIARFSAEARAAGRGRVSAETIHALRIRGKRTRYAIEILGPPAAPAPRGPLAWFEHFQDLAGAFVDHLRAAERLRRLAAMAGEAPARRAVSGLARAEEVAAARARKRVVVAIRAASRRAFRRGRS